MKMYLSYNNVFLRYLFSPFLFFSLFLHKMQRHPAANQGALLHLGHQKLFNYIATVCQWNKQLLQAIKKLYCMIISLSLSSLLVSPSLESIVPWNRITSSMMSDIEMLCFVVDRLCTAAQTCLCVFYVWSHLETGFLLKKHTWRQEHTMCAVMGHCVFIFPINQQISQLLTTIMRHHTLLHLLLSAAVLFYICQLFGTLFPMS